MPAFAGIQESLHATPLEIQQTLSAYLFAFGLSLSQQLDQRFHLHPFTNHDDMHAVGTHVIVSGSGAMRIDGDDVEPGQGRPERGEQIEMAQGRSVVASPCGDRRGDQCHQSERPRDHTSSIR